MWQGIGILVGGYGFIVLSYAWMWVLAAGIWKSVRAERLDRPGRADIKAIVGVMAFWTMVWAIMMFMGQCK